MSRKVVKLGEATLERGKGFLASAVSFHQCPASVGSLGTSVWFSFSITKLLLSGPALELATLTRKGEKIRSRKVAQGLADATSTVTLLAK